MIIDQFLMYVLPNREQEARLGIEDQQKILEWLAPPKLNLTIGQKEPDTNEWFLQGKPFNDWLAGSKHFLFVHGPMGCGKTVLLKSAADYCRQHAVSYNKSSHGPHKATVVTFFFSATTNPTFGLNHLLRYTIAKLSPLHAIPMALQQFYKESNESYPLDPPEDDNKLVGVLQEILAGAQRLRDSSSPKVYLFLDGLDEIRTQRECQKVTGFLNGLAKLDLDTLKILITSRPLQLPVSWHAIWEQYAIPMQNVAEDIGKYVTRAVAHLDISLQRRIVEKLTGPTQNM